jgi:beta-galactosidase
MYVDSAPDWVAEQFPHALFETQSGIKVYPQSAPGACTDNADVEKAVLDFYTETAKVASSYPNFFGWDLWSEPHIINWAHLWIMCQMFSSASVRVPGPGSGTG